MRRLLLTLCVLLLGVTAGAQDFIRYYPPPFLGLTTNGAAITSTVPILLPDGTAGAPSLAFASDADGTGTGFLRNFTNEIAVSINGTARFLFKTGAFTAATSDFASLGEASTPFATAYVSRSTQGSRPFILTDGAAAVTFVRIAVPTNANMAGKLIYTATSTDGASGSLTSHAEYNFAGADIGGTVTCGISAQLGVATAYSRANTLLCTVTTVTSTTNCDLQATCTDNKAAAQTITLKWRLDMPITNTVTPQ